MILVFTPGCNPLPQTFDFFRSEPILEFGWRHLFVGIFRRDASQQFALVGVFRSEDVDRGSSVVQSQVSLSSFCIRSVTGKAFVGKDGADVSLETQIVI